MRARWGGEMHADLRAQLPQQVLAAPLPRALRVPHGERRGGVCSAHAPAWSAEKPDVKYFWTTVDDHEFQIAALRGKRLRAPVDVGALVDRVVSCMGKNPYLGAALAVFASKGYRFSGTDEAALLGRVLA